jgi:CheY-like chemotaxis protein
VEQTAASDAQRLTLRLMSTLAHGCYYCRSLICAMWVHLREPNLAEACPPSRELAQAYSEHAPAMSLVPALRRAAPQTLQSSDRVPQSLHILVADDSPVNLEVAIGLLEMRGHTADTVENGLAAVETSGQGRFDVILMDLEIPHMDGLTAARLIRRREEESGSTRRTPIVTMTAHALLGFREQCIEAGMDGYISKPVNAAELFQAIESFSDQREYGDRLAASV